MPSETPKSPSGFDTWLDFAVDYLPISSWDEAARGELAALRERAAELEGQLASAKTLLDASVRTGVIAQARNAALDEAAMLHEQIPNHCSHEINCPGCGAIGAIVRYRDAIRALKGP